MVRPLKVLLSLLVLLALVSSCATSDGDASDDDASTTERDTESTRPDDDGDDDGDAATPVFDEDDCPDLELVSSDELDEMGAICGTVEVPEDHDDPGGEQIELAVLVLPAEGDDPEPDPIVYLDGGPGGDGLSNAASFATSPWRETRDLILYSQRGTGGSSPVLDCEASDEAFEEFLPLEPDSEEAEELSDELFVECRDDLLDEGIDLQQYNSANSAKDLALLRVAMGEALGFDEWNLFGISYGTRLALTVLRDEPEGVRSVVIDSVYPPSRDLGVEVGANAQRAFDTLFERCAADPSCDARYPDLAARWEALVEQTEEDPVTLETEALVSDVGGEVLIDGDSLVSGLFQLLYVDDLIPQLPSMIADMEDGDFEFFASVLLELSYSSAIGISEGMYYSVQCQEEIPFSSPELAERAMEGLPEVTARVFDPTQDYEDCETWGVEPSGDIENEPVTSDVPTLVMSGAFDPITPESWAADAAATLTNHFFVVIEAGAHGPSLGSCGERIVQGFLDDPTSDPTLPCAEESGRIRWA